MADQIDDAFAAACRAIFGRSLGPLSKYEDWLRSRIVHIRTVPSALGSGDVPLPDYAFFGFVPKSRAVAYSNSRLAEKLALPALPPDATLASLLPQIKTIAYFVPNFAEGKNMNVSNSVAYLDCLNVRDGFDPFRTKNSAYIYQTLDCEGLFGVYYALSSNFNIHCYNILSSSRCFEMDTAQNCSDCLFCHNVENLQDCMFCFNTKGKRYCIGNVEVGRDNYLRVKSLVQKELADGLEKNGRLPFDIYTVLAKK